MPAPAQASPILELVGGVTGGGFNARVLGTGPEAAYFNPALMAGTAGHGTGVPDAFFAVFGAWASLSVSLSPRPAGVDIAPSIYDAWLSDGMGGIRPLDEPGLATADLRPRQDDPGGGLSGYLGVGVVERLAGDKLVVGFHGAIPTGDIQAHRVFYADEREQYFSNSLRFELYDDRLSLSTFAFAVSSRPIPRLAVGVGLVAAIDSTAQTPVYVPDGSDLGRIYLDQELTVGTGFSPHIGAELLAMAGLRLTATVHAPSRVRVSGKNSIQLANGTTAEQTFSFTHGYEPLTVGAAASWETALGSDRALALAGSVAWRDFSAYEDRHSESPLDSWRDIVITSLGARVSSKSTRVFADATYAPSPVPDQIGRTNYVDNARLGVVTGVSTEARILGTHLRAGLFVQGHRLVQRSVDKREDAPNPVIDEFPDNAVDPVEDRTTPLPEAQGLQTNNPGYPGFSSEGWLLAAGFSLEMPF